MKTYYSKHFSSVFHGQAQQEIFKVKMTTKISVAGDKNILRKISSNMHKFISNLIPIQELNIKAFIFIPRINGYNTLF